MSMTDAQQIALAIAPKFTAFASIVGQASPDRSVSGTSTTVVYSSKTRRSIRGNPNSTEGTYHRLILGLAFGDLFASVAWFLTTWPIPKGTPGVYGAVGNQATCTAQGFFTQSSIVAVGYNLALSFYYQLVIVRGWKKDKVLKVEPYFHAFAILVGLGTAIPLVALGMFNQAVWDCWIAPSPLGCNESWDKSPAEDKPPCDRGDNASVYRFIFYYAPLWIAILTIIVLVCLMFFHVRGVERQLLRHATMRIMNDSAMGTPNLSKGVYKQALYYVGAFFVTWVFPTVYQITFAVGDHGIMYPLLFLTAFFIPVQGALNLIVYLRPKFVKYRAERERQRPRNKTSETSNTDNQQESLVVSWFQMFRRELSFQTNGAGDDVGGDKSNLSVVT